MSTDGTKRGEYKQRENIREIRKKTLLRMTKTLGISDNSTHSQIRKEIHARVEKHIHYKDIHDAPSAQLVTLMSLNMRGLRSKLTSIDGIDLFA